MQIISFYEMSSTDFRITLDQLDKDLSDLVLVSKGLSTSSVKLLLTMSYLQKSSLRSTNTKREQKTFRSEVILSNAQINKVVQMYSVIRNIGSQNQNRLPYILSDISVDFQAGVLIKIPNVGNPTFYPTSDKSYFQSDASLSITYSDEDYLNKNREYRWILKAKNQFSSQWGDKNSFYYITIIDDSGSAVFESITTGLTIIGMYTTFIYVVGVAIAKVFKELPESIWVKCIPRAEPILKLCEAVALARSEEDLDKEVRTYYRLIDLMRSPELIKMIGEEYDSFMMAHRESKVKQEIWIVKRDMMIENKKKMEDKKKGHRHGKEGKK